MRELLCPQCSGKLVQRTRRRGLRERLWSLFWIYPFRCQRCGHRFRTQQQGVRYVRTTF
jgi:DNA-directed RNA polymerase subunit RPC12/RpoP